MPNVSTNEKSQKRNVGTKERYLLISHSVDLSTQVWRHHEAYLGSQGSHGSQRGLRSKDLWALPFQEALLLLLPLRRLSPEEKMGSKWGKRSYSLKARNPAPSAPRSYLQCDRSILASLSPLRPPLKRESFSEVHSVPQFSTKAETILPRQLVRIGG